MRGLFISIMFLLNIPLIGQNLISNGDFEQCDTSSLAGVSGCSGLPDGDPAELPYVIGWQDVKLPPTNVRGTVDWWQNGSICQWWQDAYTKSCATVSAQSGTKFIGMFDGEGAKFDFGSDLPIGIYKVTFWAKGNYYNTNNDYGVGSSGVWGVSLTIDDDDIKLADQCTLASGFTIFEQSYPASDYQDWHKIECFFDTRTQAVRYLVLGGIFDRDCGSHHAYLYIDNITVEKTCCARIMRYQNTSYDSTINLLPRLTQRSDTIIAGDTVSIHTELSHGPVIVEKDSSVRFQAAHCITLAPGFRVDSGGVFTGVIGDCERSDSTDIDYEIQATWFTGEDRSLTQLRCRNDSIYYCLNFVSKGATHYKVIMLNRDREIFYEAEGEVTEILTSYFCGNGASGQSPLVGAVEIVLQLFNCANTKLYDWQVNIEYDVDGGCSPAAKTNEVYPIKNSTRSGILLYPNPTSDVLHISAGHASILSVEITNELGQTVWQRDTSSNSSLAEIDVSSFENGIYICKVNTSENFTTQRIIINR